MRNLFCSSVMALTLAFTGAATSNAEPVKAAAASNVPTSDISPAKLALLKRLDQAMDFDGMMKKMYEQMMPAMFQSLRQSNPKITDQQVQDVTQVTISVTTKYTPRMKDEMFRAYAKVFTEEELNSMVVFYESPNGQAVLKKLPQVMQEFMPAMSSLMPDMMKDIQKGLCDKGLCSEQAAPAK
ncbi:DUF2059 domain-containing protein [Asticcacaulis sp. 201]|uniref:DUF2059 domain-containing protein n=1 Tax=Asticcacaulis sp. 201 TaxID=3028787 RepID=UPI00291704FA|nr:DUF2059 domain-containing protein [Asticcacaulis sp. 201]MDV6331369.1 DUF2059 domain-containing protein [Asticcacaulis sp. 201]